MSEEERKLADKIGVYGQTVNVGNVNFDSPAPTSDPRGLHNLPPGIPNGENFFGRRSKLDRLVQLLREPRQVLIAAVEGMGGIGKTELAIQYARQYQQDYGAVLWIRAAEALELVVTTTLKAFPQVFDQVQQLTRLEDQVEVCWRQWQRIEGRVLVIFDDVIEVGEVLKAVPPVQDPFRVIFTSRQDFIDPRRFVKLRLGVLEEAAALQLLRSIAGEVIDGELEQARILCERLGYLPLALELVGAFLVQEPDVGQVLADLQRYGLSAEALTEANWAITAERGVRAAFELSWERLSSEDQRLAVILGLMALAPIPWNLLVDVDQKIFENSRRIRMQEEGIEVPEEFDGLEGWDPKPLERARRHLKRLNLIEDLGDQVYQLHPLIREFFRERQREWDPQADLELIKGAYVGILLQVAKGIRQNITIDQVEQIRPSIPFLSQVAEEIEEWKPYVADEDLIGPFMGLGWFYEGQGLYAQAEPWLQQCIKVIEASLGLDHPDIVTSLNNLALLYSSQGRYEKAESLYQEIMPLSQKLLGPNHPHTVTNLNNFAELYRAQGRYEEAKPLHEEALVLRQQIFGPNHPHVAQSFNNLGLLYFSQGHYKEAEALLQQALKLWKNLLGSDHPDVASSLNNLAELYRAQGRYEEAEPLYLQALVSSQKLLGTDHPDIAISLNNLAELYRAQGRYEEAEPLYQQALALWKKLLGPDHPDIAISLNNLATLYESQGRYEEAEPLYQQALALRQRLLGPNHPDIAISLNNLAGLYSSQGRYEEAKPLYQQALVVGGKILGHKHPHVAATLNNLATLYFSQGHYEEAEPLYQQALELWEKFLGYEHPDVTVSLDNLAALYESQGHYEEAEPLHQKALALRQKLLGPDHPYVATSLNNLGILYFNQQQYDQAQRHLKQSLAIRQLKLGSEHPHTQKTAQDLQQARMMQALETQRSDLEALLNQNPELKDQIQTALRQILNRDPTPDDLLMALMQIIRSSQAGDDPE